MIFFWDACFYIFFFVSVLAFFVTIFILFFMDACLYVSIHTCWAHMYTGVFVCVQKSSLAGKILLVSLRVRLISSNVISSSVFFSTRDIISLFFMEQINFYCLSMYHIFLINSFTD